MVDILKNDEEEAKESIDDLSGSPKLGLLAIHHNHNFLCIGFDCHMPTVYWDSGVAAAHLACLD